MLIRSYTAADAPAAIALWNACLPEDLLDEKNFYTRIICDVNFDPNLYLLAVENDELLGFAYGTKRQVPDETAGLQPDKAWIVAMGVAPNHRRKGVGTALIRAVESALESEKIELGTYSTNYFFPGIDQVAYGE